MWAQGRLPSTVQLQDVVSRLAVPKRSLPFPTRPALLAAAVPAVPTSPLSRFSAWPRKTRLLLHAREPPCPGARGPCASWSQSFRSSSFAEAARHLPPPGCHPARPRESFPPFSFHFTVSEGRVPPRLAVYVSFRLKRSSPPRSWLFFFEQGLPVSSACLSLPSAG